MNPKELKKLVKTLRELGVTHFKDGNIELSLTPSNDQLKEKDTQLKPVEISTDEEKEIKHKLEEMTSIMKLGDMELVDRLFPDHTNYEDEAV